MGLPRLVPLINEGIPYSECSCVLAGVWTVFGMGACTISVL